MMEKSVDDVSAPSVENLYITARDLKSRQSVRATFRLPEEVIQLLGIMARQLGVQQKSLFDQLIEDSEVLQQVASEAQPSRRSTSRKRQKTYVLSKRSLEILETVSRRGDISRDQLVEISIRRLLPVMSDEQEKHRKRLLLYKRMGGLRQQFDKLAQEAEQLLGEDDKAAFLIREVSDALEENCTELHTVLEKGQAVEEYDKAQLSE